MQTEELMRATELLNELGFHKDTKAGATGVLKKLNELGLQVKGQTPYAKGMMLFISRADGNALKEKIRQQRADAKLAKQTKTAPPENDKHEARLRDIEYFVESTNRALFSIAEELGMTLCHCGAKRPADKTEECPNCGAYESRH